MSPVTRENHAAEAAAVARDHGQLLLLGGPPGAGKSAVAEIVAAAAPRPAVHLRTDSFYAWIRSGFVPPYLPEAEEQNQTVTAVMTTSATAYARGGYDVIADGIIGPWLLPAFLAACEPDAIAVSYAVLRPTLEVTLARATARTGGQLTDPEPVTGLYRAFTRLGGLESHVIDSTAQAPGQTAAELTTALDRGTLTLPPGWRADAPGAGAPLRRLSRHLAKGRTVRVLLSTIGSRGDVQPLAALASQLRAAGHQARLCVPPDFRDWIEGLGFPVTPIGPRLRPAGNSTARPASPAPPSPERLRQLAEATVADQFTTVSAAAEGCDVIVAATALQIAARSVAEALGIGYVFAALCPAVLPSPHHAPPPLPAPGQAPPPAAGNQELWERDAGRFNAMFGPALDRHRANLGLPAVGEVRSHVFTSRPWLAADPALAPWPGPDGAVFQPGAWILPDQRPLPPALEDFLQAGEPPVYFGFGSMRMPPGLADVITATARAAGRRAVISSGWAALALPGSEPGCLLTGEVNQQQLFARVAAVVHHGGAGTTTTAALAGTPQVIIPQAYDQHYWARRVRDLGSGTAHAPGTPTAQSLAAALTDALRPEVASRARSIAPAVRTDGAATAAGNLAATARPA